MIDILFYMAVHDLKYHLMNGEKLPREEVYQAYENARSKTPVVYNIETTNNCNMRCAMCPRTTIMTRPVKTMDLKTAKRVIDQLTPWTSEQWERWQSFVESAYGYDRNDMSENHFFLHIIPKVVVLHGYGDPLLDPHMPEIVKMLTDKNIPSYFSCNPANINMDKTIQTFENGLQYIKYSIESVDDVKFKAIRGQAANFTESYKNIVKLLDIKAQRNYPINIVITMLNLNRVDQAEEYARLKEAFKGMDVYIYIKSEDQQWYREDRHGTSSIHWTEFCQFPWSSMTIKSDGLAVECVEDYDNEIILGDAKTQSLDEIWNGKAYEQFRLDHFDVKPGIKCSERCDMTLIGELLK
jgi:wyosine [tRNA(Phe)-imidazoG37] synthetase (radical SAM superfamily)